MKQREFIRPSDWPEQNGAIDLNIHDLPHASSSIEWWYMNGHFTGDNGQDYSIFASFFRKLISIDEISKMPEYAHSITWAIVDVKNEEYYSNSLVDKKTPEIGLKKLRKGELVKDPYLRKAAIEMLEKNVVPYPDRLFEGDVKVDLDRLDLTYDTNTFSKNEDGEYHLHCYDREHQMSCDLIFTPDKPVIKHGDNGVVYGASSENMFYYFIPRNIARGKIELGNTSVDINGSVWYDHEFGRSNPTNDDHEDVGSIKMDTSWNWISGQLDNGTEFSAYHLMGIEDNEIKDSCLLIIDKDGQRHKVSEFSLEPIDDLWTSMRTFQDYPLCWQLKAPEFGVDLIARASFPTQEFSTVISKPAFWEGRMNIEGAVFGGEVKGVGFLEVNGYTSLDTLEDFFKIVSRETIKSVKYILPKSPNEEELNALITHAESNRFSTGVNATVYSKSVIEPIRSIIDRGGKSWRSYAALACCDVVGGNAQKARHWLSLPELMHVGSLIVDDVQDKSAVRRGGPACHEVYGTPLAINAGSACYFISQICVYSDNNMDDSDKLKIYDYYFEALRAGHSGQALDIYGLDYLMDDVIEDNSGHVLEESVLAVHKLKCAAPSYYLARIGSVIGGGSDTQSDALATFYESLGIAFQIIDDTLNISGFQDNLKTKAEDISAGKITYPVAKAMHRLEKDDRQRLWEILQCKTEDRAMIKEAVDLLTKVDALKLCEQEAREIMDDGWHALDPHVRDSMVKLNLRAFSWFVLDRHY